MQPSTDSARSLQPLSMQAGVGVPSHASTWARIGECTRESTRSPGALCLLACAGLGKVSRPALVGVGQRVPVAQDMAAGRPGQHSSLAPVAAPKTELVCLQEPRKHGTDIESFAVTGRHMTCRHRSVIYAEDGMLAGTTMCQLGHNLARGRVDLRSLGVKLWPT